MIVVVGVIVLSAGPVGRRLPAGVLTRPCADQPRTRRCHERTRRRTAPEIAVEDAPDRGRRPRRRCRHRGDPDAADAPDAIEPRPRRRADEPVETPRRRGRRRRPRRRGRWHAVGPRTVGRFIADALRAAGVRYAFTVPGESFLGLLDALGDAGIRVVATRHEGGAAFMAEAHGQLTGRPAACLGDARGRGANLAIGIHTARQDSSPMFVARRAGRARLPRPRGVPGDRPGRDASAASPSGPSSRAGAEDVPAAMAAGRARGPDRSAGSGPALAPGGPARRGDRLEPADAGSTRRRPARPPTTTSAPSSSCSPPPDVR